MSEQTTLHLTESEQAAFASLPPDLQNGWTIRGQAVTYVDSDEDRELRVSHLRLHDPILRGLQEKVKSARTAEDIARVIKETDMSKIDDADLPELFFALGPDAVTNLIALQLAELPTLPADEARTALEYVCALGVIRRDLLESLPANA